MSVKVVLAWAKYASVMPREKSWVSSSSRSRIWLKVSRSMTPSWSTCGARERDVSMGTERMRSGGAHLVICIIGVGTGVRGLVLDCWCWCGFWGGGRARGGLGCGGRQTSGGGLWGRGGQGRAARLGEGGRRWGAELGGGGGELAVGGPGVVGDGSLCLSGGHGSSCLERMGRAEEREEDGSGRGPNYHCDRTPLYVLVMCLLYGL